MLCTIINHLYQSWHEVAPATHTAFTSCESTQAYKTLHASNVHTTRVKFHLRSLYTSACKKMATTHYFEDFLDAATATTDLGLVSQLLLLTIQAVHKAS